MGATPDTLKVVKIVHDTITVFLRDTVRDTVVRVAEPYDSQKPNWFLGRMYPIDVIVAGVALVNAGYTIWIRFIQRPKITLNLGDYVGIALNPGDVGRKLHLRCNFVNTSVKMGSVQHLEVLVTGPGGFGHRFRWHLFYVYEEGGDEVKKETDVFPLAVAGHDSHLKFIEFEGVDVKPPQRLGWKEGRYELSVDGWVNRGSRVDSANMRTTCHFNLSKKEADLLRTLEPAQPQLMPLPLEEWATPS